MVTRIILIRHGETDWNLQGRYQGHSNIDINTKGRNQAKKLAIRLKKASIDRVFASDRKRAINTARLIFPGRRMKIDKGLREISFGIFEGLVYDEILERHSKLYSRWIKNPFGIKILGGESGKDFKSRVSKAFKKIVSSNKGRTIAIVTHGGPINMILTGILKIARAKDFIPGHVSISIVELENREIRIISFNDMEHLKNG